jgi:hypothetical protein
MGWQTSRELLEEIQEAHKRLVTGDIDAVKAHAEARLLGAAAKVLNIQLDHAKATQRLIEGSDVLPDFKIGGGDTKARKQSAA